MPLRTKNLKNINLFLALLFTGYFTLQAQDKSTKIDGVAVVVGKNIVLDSDIEKFKKEIEAQTEGKKTISDCAMLEKLMNQKLLAHHAVVDSVTVTQTEVDERVNQSMQFFTQEYGSVDKVVKAYGFNDVVDLKKELGRVQKENLLIQKEQVNITKKIDVTPEEVRVYYKSLQESDALPQIPEQVQLAQLVIKAKPAEGEEQRIIDKLNQIKKEIQEGGSFKLKAIINSTDPSVTQNGGFLGAITKKTNFVKEFKEAAFSLEKGEMSEPIKTMFGYHLILLNDIKGEAREVSHILMQPKISDEAISKAKAKAEKLIEEIKAGKITFKEAVEKNSDDEGTKFNGGLIINPYTGESVFEPTRMNDPALYARISDLKQGEFSEVFYDETREGEKMYKFIYLKKKMDAHKADLVKDYVKVKELALLKKKEETIEKWSKEKIKDTYIKLHNNYKKCDFKSDWRKESK